MKTTGMHLSSTLLLFLASPFIPSCTASSESSLCAAYPQQNTTYPSRYEICQIFSGYNGPVTSNGTMKLVEHISLTVQWTMEGTHPVAGTYSNLTVLAGALGRIAALTAKPLNSSVINIIGGGDEEWSTVELRDHGICKNGLVFDNRYAWILRWSKARLIVEARAYMDSRLVNEAIVQNEIGSSFTYSDIRTENTPYTDLDASQLMNATGLQVEK